MRPSVVVSMDTNNGDRSCSPAALLKHQYSVPVSVRDCSAIISRWSPFGTVTCQCSWVAGEPNDVQSTVRLTNIANSLCFWEVCDYGNTSRSRGAATVCIHMTWLHWSKFDRHCFGRFLHDLEAPRLHRTLVSLGRTFGLLSHIETSKTVSNYYLETYLLLQIPHTYTLVQHFPTLTCI